MRFLDRFAFALMVTCLLAATARAQAPLPEPSRSEINQSCIAAATAEFTRMLGATPTGARTRTPDSGRRTDRVVELEGVEAGQKVTYLFTCGLDPLTNKAYSASAGKKQKPAD